MPRIVTFILFALIISCDDPEVSPSPKRETWWLVQFYVTTTSCCVLCVDEEGCDEIRNTILDTIFGLRDERSFPTILHLLPAGKFHIEKDQHQVMRGTWRSEQGKLHFAVDDQLLEFEIKLKTADSLVISAEGYDQFGNIRAMFLKQPKSTF